MLSTADVHRKIRAAGATGQWLISRHAQERVLQRGFTAPDIERVLKSGIHYPSLDELKDGRWRYRIAGNTSAGKVIQLAVAIETEVVVVTVIG